MMHTYRIVNRRVSSVVCRQLCTVHMQMAISASRYCNANGMLSVHSVRHLFAIIQNASRTYTYMIMIQCKSATTMNG